ncbi:MAG: riboflavin synthase [Planctomycetes bacterium]|nr:riboflavin synthase [Planctomycetota bacterium]
MFTGIVQQLGVVGDIQTTDLGRRLGIDSRGWPHRPAAGESIAVNGCCLTITAPTDHREPVRSDDLLRFDVIHQTLGLTTLGELAVGDPVNLEPAVTATTLLSGHVVQGHIDGVGVVGAVDTAGSDRRLRIEPPPELMEYIIPRGSIAVDGVSLTVAEVGESFFEVALIPTTLDLTTLGRAEPGQRVNLETDYLVKAVVHWLRRQHVDTAL